MSQLLVPGGFVPAGSDRGPFDRLFFAEHFKEGIAACCQGYERGEVPVVVLELANGVSCDVFAFEAFKKNLLVAQVFVDPPDCDDVYLSFIRYETIFRVNVRYYPSPDRRLGFKVTNPEVEDGDDEGGDAAGEGAEGAT